MPARCSSLASQALKEKGGAAKNKAINALPLCYMKPYPSLPSRNPSRALAELGTETRQGNGRVVSSRDEIFGGLGCGIFVAKGQTVVD